MKKFIYLISPQKIKGIKFYKKLDQVLGTKKVKYFQLRLKKTPTSKLIKIAIKIKKITKKNKVKLLINDNPKVAKLIDADGCHVGQNDMSLVSCRKILGKNKIIGVTCHNSKKFTLNAKKNKANYVAFGSFLKVQQKKLSIKQNCKYCVGPKKKLVCRLLQ